MLKPCLARLLILGLFFSLFNPVYAQYDRNQAVAVEKVVYGDIVSVRNIIEQQLIEDSNQGWKSFGGALLGGVIGHQFGGGSGQDVATVLGTIVGAQAGYQYDDAGDYQELKLVELMIRQDDGQTIMIIQDVDPGMVFAPGYKVRVVYLASGVRVDIAM